MAALGMTGVEPAFIRGYVDFDERDLGVEDAAALRRRLAAHGLTAPAVSAHFDLSHPDAPAMLARRIGFTAGLGAAILITNAGPAADECAILRVIEGALPELEAAGVTLALENPGHGTGDLIGNGRVGAALMARINHPGVGLNYDAGNVFTYSGGGTRPDDDLPHALRHVVHLHLKDIADDGAGAWRFCPLGEGLIDWTAVARALAARPAPPCGLELPLRLRRPGRGDPVRAPDPAPLETIRAGLAASRAHWAAACAASLAEPS
nr:TIM barrel protein [Paracoccus sp. S-4012]